MGRLSKNVEKTTEKMGLYKITANKRFNYSKNVKNIRRREKKKERNQKKFALLTEEAKIIHKHWDHSKGMKSNMNALGLSMDPNKTIKIDKARLMPVVVNSKAGLIAELEEAAKNEAKSEWMVSQDDVHF